MDSASNSVERLNSFVGRWEMEAFGATARSEFEWIQNGTYLVQRTEVDHPDAPDSLAIIAEAPGGSYVEHYFDSRGVIRLYDVTFENGVWTVTRDKPDFSPLDFRQRYVGTFSADGRMITGAWEIDHGDGWEKDFDLNYTRVD